MKTVKTALPAAKHVDQFTVSVAPIFKRQDLLDQENQNLSQLRDCLLPMLMTDQITVA